MHNKTTITLKSLLQTHKRLVAIDLILILLALLYYLFFVNKGLILSDEGYYVHYAQRIADGQIAYKDFLLQYTPGYFYLLALLYKIFGLQILVGRFLSLFFCLFLLISTLALLYVHKITSPIIHVLVSLTMTALGYPLLHIPLVIWPLVLFAVLLDITYIYWYRYKKTSYLFILGFLLALSLFFRQHLGAVYFIIITGLILLNGGKDLLTRFKSLLIVCGVWLLFTAPWIYFFFIHTHNLSGLYVLYKYNRQFISTFPFSYPPITYLLQPTGLFKLLPYYFPVIYGFIILLILSKKHFDWEKLSLALFTLCGFFTTIYPASDLLHVYPFLGLVNVSSIIFSYKKKYSFLVLAVSIVFILLGFYLTFFTGSYRYDTYFLKETMPLQLPKTKGILVDPNYNSGSDLVRLYNYINKHTRDNDYIFVYPFSPMLYFVLDRHNPSGIVQFVLLEAPPTIYSEDRVLSEMRQRRVKYIITAGAYKFDRKISKFIQKQKKVHRSGFYTVFQITSTFFDY